MEEQNPTTPTKKSTFKFVLVIVALILIAAGAGGTYFFYTKYQSANKLLSDPNAASKVETDSVVSKVSKLMVLPDDEDASLATVLDASKLSDQPFFKKAQNGDKVLIYTKAKIAILYRPNNNIIIAVAPVSIGDNGQTQDLQVKIALLNGSTVAGLTKTAETAIKAQFPKATFTAVSNAARDDYQDSVVIDLTGGSPAVASALAQVLGANVGSLPEGEVAPQGSDMLVILGSSYSK